MTNAENAIANLKNMKYLCETDNHGRGYGIFHVNEGDKAWIDEAIKALEQSEWTLVSEQEPTTASHVLVSTVDDVVCEADYGVIRHDAPMNTLAKEFLESIVAWRPMPEPYKEEV